MPGVEAMSQPELVGSNSTELRGVKTTVLPMDSLRREPMYQQGLRAAHPELQIRTLESGDDNPETRRQYRIFLAGLADAAKGLK